MSFGRAKTRILAAFLSILTVLWYCGVAEAIVISSNTTWTDPAALNDSLIINPGVTLRILNGNGVDGGDLLINLPNGGIFQIQNGGILNLNGVAANSNAGNLTVLLTGPAGNIDIAGVIVAQGLGTGSGGVITLNGSSFNLANTGVIYANNPLGLGGRVTMNNPSGLINVQNGFQVYTNGLSDATHNLIEISGVGVNVSGILNANGTLAGTGSSGGTVNLVSTGGASDININSTIYAAGTQGQNGGTISITSGRDVNVNNNLGGTLIAGSASGGTNIGNGGTVDLDANRHITITAANNGSYVINVNAAEAPLTTTGNGMGGNVYLSANTGDITISQSSAGNRGVIEANGAFGGTGRGGVIQFEKANNVIITNSGPKRITLLARGGRTGTAVGGNGGTIQMGGAGVGEDITGNVTIDDSVLWTYAGNVNTTSTGHGGTVDIEMDGNFSATNTTIQSLAAGGSGNGGSMRLVSNSGDISLNDANTYFLLWSNGSGVVDVSGNNITNAGTIGSRAARTSTGPALNTNSGGLLNLTATGTLNNTGDINASAWTPRLDYIATNEESTGAGGTITINANTLVNNGDIHAYGGLNTQGAQQGRGGNIDIDVTNAFTLGSAGHIDSRGEPFNTLNPAGDNRIDIDAGSMVIDGTINASGFYANDAGGRVELTSSQAGGILINNSGLVSASGGIGDIFNNAGPGGSILIESNNGGNIDVAGDVHAIGRLGYNGGNITLTANGAGRVNMHNTGRIDASSTNGVTTGNGGTITINSSALDWNLASGGVSFLNVAGNTNTAANQAGDGGTINITTTGNLNITSTSNGTNRPMLEARGGANGTGGDGGVINLTSTGGNVNLTNTNTGVRLLASADTRSADGSGGLISITANGSYAATNMSMVARGQGGAGSSGGDISITANSGITRTNNDLDVRGNDSWGGNLTMDGGTGLVSVDSASSNITQGWANASNNSITIRGGSLQLNSLLDADGDQSTGSAGGDVTLEARTGNIAMNAAINNRGYVDTAGDVSITAAGSYTGTNANIVTDGIGAGSLGGNIDITAGNGVTLINSDALARGNDAWGGTLNIDGGAGAVNIDAASALNTSGWGDASNNNIDITGTTLTLNSAITAIGDSSTGSHGGTVTLQSTTGDIVLNNRIQSIGYGAGNTSGDISIASAGAFTATNANIQANAGNTAAGGNITVTSTGNQTYVNSDLVANANDSWGGTVNVDAGNATVAVDIQSAITTNGWSDASNNNVTVRGGAVTIDSYINANGDSSTGSNGGDVVLQSRTGNLALNRRIRARGYGAGNSGGTVNITSAGTYTATASNIEVQGGNAGAAGGDVNITSVGAMDLVNSDIIATGNDSWGGTITLDSGNSTMTIDSGSPLSTTGWGDGSNNMITLRGGILDLNSRLTANGDSSTGSAAGTVTLLSRVGDITVNHDIYADGQVRSATQNGNGGTVTITAFGSYFQNANDQIRTYSRRRANVQALDGGHGGNVSITATNGSINMTRGNSSLIYTEGVDYGANSPDHLTGGNGGNITLTANTGINLNGGSGNATYLDARGGVGRNNGNGGNGGIITLTTGNSILNINAPGTNNFRVTGGAHQGTGTGVAGTDGQVWIDGILQ